MAISRIAEKMYGAALRLYPSRFQAEFGAEIRDVFSENLRQAERRGILPALAVSLREAADLPINLISEYWEDLQMRNPQLSQPVIRPVLWGAVGFGCSAVLVNLFTTLMYLRPSGSANTFISDWFLWGELLGFAVMGGLGGLLFALVCRQPEKARAYFMGGSLGFLIGHVLWYAVMFGSALLLLYTSTDGFAQIVIRWVDLALMMSLSGLFIGWMDKNGRQAGRLAGSGLLGAGIGGLLGLAICGVLVMIGPPLVGGITLSTSQLFVVNSLAGISGGALLGRAILRDIPFRASPVAS
jgi:hypothetical protein